MDDTTPPRTRWFHLTPGRFVIGLLGVEVLLWLSERSGWLGWHKGYAVLTGVAVMGVAMIVMLGWFAVALVFRRRFQFSLWSLFVLTIAIAIPCSWLAVEMKRTREQNAILQVEGGSVRFDYQSDMWDAAEPPGPAWLRRLVGDEFFFARLEDVYLNVPHVTETQIEQLKDLPTLKSVAFAGLKITDAELTRLRAIKHITGLGLEGSQITDAGLGELGSFPQLQWLTLNPQSSTISLQHVKGLVSLQGLSLAGTQITDTGIEHLKELRQLRSLWLNGTNITDDGIQQLKYLVSLQELYLHDTKVTDAGVANLQKALPNCKIIR